MSKLIDLTGKTFSRLTVIRRTTSISTQTTQAVWLCRCACGNMTTVVSDNLRSKNTESCGCYRNEQNAVRSSTHGMSNVPEYGVWIDIKSRCYNKNVECYENYGGRGITVCDSWLNSFDNFIRDMGKRPNSKYEIDRKDNNGNYSPDNCRWVTTKINTRNQRRSRYWFIDGTCYESSYHAAEMLSISRNTVERWCNGVIKNGEFIPPKQGCYSELKYQLANKELI